MASDGDSELIKPGISSKFSEEHPSTTENGGFLGTVVCFLDGSYWKLTRTLSRTKYQQAQPPYEATQVFACICLEDPDKKYEGIEEAVIKVKYQYDTMPLLCQHAC